MQNTFRQVAGSLGTAVIVSASTVATNMVSGSTDAVTAGVFGIHTAFAVAGPVRAGFCADRSARAQ